ncbi:MAG: GTP-binding protein [Candidatus Thermoplasmatota archaeon]|nr:GTP-binding protein [Candidatus Thermoplasmatota archaeon]
MASIVRKICLLGDGAVGKTSLIRRFVYDEFSDEYLTTFGTKVTKKVIDIGDTKLTLMIWDILGQKQHARLHSAYYQGATGAMVVCDLTRRETFANMDDWISSFSRVAGQRPIVLLGNKCDLEGYVTVGESALEKKCKKYDASHLLCSAKTGQNVEEAFQEIASRLIEGR